ncbi:DNA translocase FtsK [Domibacillus epiphyticus]|uniref:Cell division protein FtsK n=1 Tax=Domibacillus epiphyticus TaxID=1714355 RepID=A0A1V2A8V3_9BACI|nr:DNA translocase FtsK [Domibacillus epiphyticus]OMP67428.1 cell division protein FtsK [Domibacillus epiphyticus]
MSIFKKILSYFREEIYIIDEEEIEPSKTEQKKQEEAIEHHGSHIKQNTESKPERRVPLNSSLEPAHQISTRVAYRYPTVKRSNNNVQPRMRKSRADTEVVKPVQHYEHENRSLEDRVQPRSFRPTEIPSPIYGFHERPVKGELQTVRGEEREKQKEPLLLLTNEHINKPMKIKKTEPSEVLKEERPVEGDVKKAPYNNEEGKLPPAERRARSKERRHSPFNVVMLKKDREKLTAAPALKAQTPVPMEVKKEPPVVIKEAMNRPPLSFLTPPAKKTVDDSWIREKTERLNDTFKSFNIDAKVTGVTTGPSITRFEVTPSIGVKVSKISSLIDDIKRSLAARTLRIESPIPGTEVVGIELPNEKSRPVFISEIISHSEFQMARSPLTSALGLDIAGEPVVLDLQKMPHGLIAGATGSGKSVCINSILVSLLYKAAPHELKLLLIDPKMVELTPYNGIPHLASPVITDVKAATAALKWAVEEMERRYQLFVHAGVRDVASYNAKVKESEYNEPHLPYLVIIIDELADLMMMAPGEVEEAICRIAQKARACGIHLIVATQRPSVDVITGLIKANIPTRIAFSVSSQIDSRTILDKVGAEKLLGKGDMLFLDNGASEAVRLQGTFVTNEEIDEVVRFVSEQQKPDYLFKQEELLQKATVQDEEDELFQEACEFVVRQGGASTSMLQRKLKVGYNRAARLIEMMEEQGLISGQRAGRPREVLVSEEELFALLDETNERTI